MPLFLNPNLADDDGLVAVGGELTTANLLRAYRAGVFPWYDAGMPVLWWSPDPRAIFELDTFHISRRMHRTLRTGKFQVSINGAFGKVIRGCADRDEGSWIHAEMIGAYENLHRLGWAHSVEAWVDGELAGGIYGVAIGAFFAGESMFTRLRDGSKVALSFLVGYLRQRGYTLFDIQMVTEHTKSLGASEIPRRKYLRRLKAALALPVTFQDPAVR